MNTGIIEATTKQISLKIQRLIHDLRSLKLLSKFEIKLLLKLLLDKRTLIRTLEL